jgi:chromosome partitioning protein
MARIITVANQKGGVGKTTTVVNVSACLAKQGKRVLVVDLDPQANCTTGLGVDPNALEFSVYEVIAQPKKFRIFAMEDIVVRTSWPNLEVAPSHVNLSGVELEIVNKLGREAILKKGLREIADRYDYILIDTPPSLGLLTVNALVASSEIVVVMRAEPWSLDGIDNLHETLSVVRDELNPELGLTGIVVNMLEPRASLSKEILDRLSKDDRLTGRIFSTNIRKNVRLAEAADIGLPVIYHDSSCHGAKAYMQLTEEIISAELVGLPIRETQPDGMDRQDLRPDEAERQDPQPEEEKIQEPQVEVETWQSNDIVVHESEPGGLKIERFAGGEEPEEELPPVPVTEGEER